MPYTKPILKRLSKNNSFRLASLFTILFIIGSVAMLSVTYYSIESNIKKSIEHEINAEITRFIGSYQSDLLGIEREPYAFFIEQSGKKLAGNVNVPTNAIQQGEDEDKLFPIEAKELNSPPNIGSEGKILGKKINLANDTTLFIGKNSYNDTKRRGDILDALGVGLFTLLFTGVLGGLFIAFNSIRRIDRISRVSQAITAGDLSVRIPKTNRRDDLEDLSNNINIMLDKINDLMQGMRLFSNNVAHDLRTPLTRMRTHIESLHKNLNGEMKEEAEKALNETDGLLQTFASLLSISQIESGNTTINRAPINLSLVCEDVLDFYEVLAEDKQQNVIVNIDKNVNVLGDKNLLFQMVVNLFTNAVKYAPEKGNISLSLSILKKRKNRYAQIIIHDSGQGVPEQDLDKITQRFYRLEKHRDTEKGNGLGLAMVKAIVDAHSGCLIFKNDIGFKVVVQIPILLGRLKK